MKGVKFGDKHSYYEWGLILSKKEIQSPNPKVNQIDIEGGDGVLDLTDFFGGVNYENRSLSFEFKKMDIVQDGFLALYSLVLNTIHGKKMRIVLDDDPLNYYFGRVTINEWKSDKKMGVIVVEVDAEPYKYKLYETVVSQTVNGSSTVVLMNSRKTVVPTIDITGNINLTFGTNYYALTEGRYILPAVQLIEGANTVLLEGTGTATFTYQERGL